MIEAITKGMIAAIRSEFGEGYQILDEITEQGLREPSFHVKCVTPTQVHNVGIRHTKAYSYNVAYFPKDTANPTTECWLVFERLSYALQNISVDGKVVRAQGEMSGKLVDGTLQFSVTYSVQAMEVVMPAEHMETLEHDTLVEQE